MQRRRDSSRDKDTDKDRTSPPLSGTEESQEQESGGREGRGTVARSHASSLWTRRGDKCSEGDEMDLLEAVIAENLQQQTPRPEWGAQQKGKKAKTVSATAACSSASKTQTHAPDLDQDGMDSVLIFAAEQFRQKAHCSECSAHREALWGIVTSERERRDLAQKQNKARAKAAKKSRKALRDAAGDSASMRETLHWTDDPLLAPSSPREGDKSDESLTASVVQAVNVLHRTVQKLRSGTGSRPATKKKRSSGSCAGEDAMLALAADTLDHFSPSITNSTSPRLTQSLREAFFAQGGLVLCSQLFDSAAGALSPSSPAWDPRNPLQCRVLGSLVALLRDSVAAPSECPDGSCFEGGGACGQLLSSGVALLLTDVLLSQLLTLSAMLDQTSLVRGGGSGSGSQHSRPEKSSKENHMPSRAADKGAAAPIPWPRFMAEMILPLLAVCSHLCEHIQQHTFQRKKSKVVDNAKVLDLLSLHWLQCVSSSGLLGTLSTLFGQFQVTYAHALLCVFTVVVICVVLFVAVCRPAVRGGRGSVFISL